MVLYKTPPTSENYINEIQQINMFAFELELCVYFVCISPPVVMETSKIDVLAPASPRLAMVTMHGCCGGFRLSRSQISRIWAERAALLRAGGILVLFKSWSGNRILAAVTEQI